MLNKKKYTHKLQKMEESKENSIKRIDETLKKTGNSSGYLGVKGKTSGHSIAYEVRNGKVSIYDGQVRKSYNSTQDFFNDQKDWTPQLTRNMRTDNLEPDLEAMIRSGAIRNRTGKREANRMLEAMFIGSDKILRREAEATIATGVVTAKTIKKKRRDNNDKSNKQKKVR